MVPLDRCSTTIFDISFISYCGRHKSLPGSDAGVPGSNSMAWSQTVCSGSLCDCCSLNTLACRWKALGTLDKSASDDVSSLPMVTFAIKYRSGGGSGFGTFQVCGTNMAL